VSFVQPSALLFGLLALPILLFYMLRMRRKEQQVPSTLLWTGLLLDRRASTPWQKLRRNLLLLLQLLILASLVLAMARPALPAAAVAGDALIVLLDASASMQAVDVSPNRFEAARQAAADLIADLAPGAAMTLILVGPEPQVLASATSDKTQLREALALASAGAGSVDWPSALALAAGTAAQAPSQATIFILSDGGLGAPMLPSLPAEIRYLPIGRSDDNLAISALALRQTARGTELYLEVHNYGALERQAVLSLAVDGSLAQAERIDLPGGESLSRALSGLPRAGRVYQAHLEGADPDTEAPLDALALDDVAYAVQRPPRERRALLFPYQLQPLRYSVFVEKVLLALDDLSPYRAVPGEGGLIAPPDEPFELYVVDGNWPGDLPPGGLLMINPPDNPLFSVGEMRAVAGPVRVAEHLLTRFVDWENIQVAQARMTDPPPGSQILVEAAGLPLVFVSEVEGRRLAVLTFDLHDSDLPLQVAFPILVAELVRYLAPGQAVDDVDLRPGQAVDINPGSQVTQVEVTSPSGRLYRLEPSASGFGFTHTEELGLYQARYVGPEAQGSDLFAVNLFEPVESSIHPAPEVPIQASTAGGTPAREVGQRELWPWVTLAALLLLMLEWWVDHQRPIRLELGRRARPGTPRGPARRR
jgi:hypothetical protein